MANQAIYYNTTSLCGKALDLAASRAMTQDQLVLSVFINQQRPLSPAQVHAIAFTEQTPLTSIRRAISTLTRKGCLVKTELKAAGKYGNDEHLWVAA